MDGSMLDMSDIDGKDGATVKFLIRPRLPARFPASVPPCSVDDVDDDFILPTNRNTYSLRPTSTRDYGRPTRWSDLHKTSEASASTDIVLGTLPPSDSDNSSNGDSHLDGLVFPDALFESSQSRRHLSRILEMTKLRRGIIEQTPVVKSNSDDDFESGLVFNDHDFYTPRSKPTKLRTAKALGQSSRFQNTRQPVPGQIVQPYARSGPPLPPVASRLTQRYSAESLVPPVSPSCTIHVDGGGMRDHPSVACASAASTTRIPRQNVVIDVSHSASMSLSEFTANPGISIPSASTSPSYAIHAASRLTMQTLPSKKKSALPLSPLSLHKPSLTRSSSTRQLRSHRDTGIKPIGKPTASPAFVIGRRFYGNGNELEEIDDLPIDDDKEIQSRVRRKDSCDSVLDGTTLHSAMGVGASGKGSESSGSDKVHKIINTLRKGSNNHSRGRSEPSPEKKISVKRSKNKREPTLIRDLNGPETARVVGQMKWNPRKFRWEGNDRALKDFEAAISAFVRPALITQFSGSANSSSPGSSRSSTQIVGNMVFDPIRMCWISSLRPEDDEPDPFAEFSDEEDASDVGEAKGGTIRATERQRTAPSNESSRTSASLSSRNEHNSSASSGTLLESADECDSMGSNMWPNEGSSYRDAHLAEARHRVQIKGWIATSDDDDRFHLLDIRTVATRQYLP